MKLSFTSITKSRVRYVLNLQINCDGKLSYYYDVTIPESYVFDVVNRESCAIELFRKRSIFKIANIYENLGSVIIDSSQKFGEFKFYNTYALQWFVTNNISTLQKVHFVSIQCLHKMYSSPLFKDKIKLESCADANECVNTELIFSKPGEKDLNQTISFKNYLLVKLWYVEYGISSCLSLIGTTTIIDHTQDPSISFFAGSGHYDILLG